MDLNRLFQMLMRMFIKTAVDSGIKYAASRGKPEAEMTPEEREQAEKGKALAKKAQDIAKITRRFGR
ncbi:hypothetical protein [Tabrizicola sp.]|uniref:hypothetical protein n=1 Tax=Tabrizicola sp. TaxID=2005166 RepID=UPI00286BA5D5|nr:hypothetical protein [Tabrizicola sp.]